MLMFVYVYLFLVDRAGSNREDTLAKANTLEQEAFDAYTANIIVGEANRNVRSDYFGVGAYSDDFKTLRTDRKHQRLYDDKHVTPSPIVSSGSECKIFLM